MEKQAPFTPEQEARIREIVSEELKAGKMAASLIKWINASKVPARVYVDLPAEHKPLKSAAEQTTALLQHIREDQAQHSCLPMPPDASREMWHRIGEELLSSFKQKAATNPDIQDRNCDTKQVCKKVRPVLCQNVPPCVKISRGDGSCSLARFVAQQRDQLNAIKAECTHHNE